MTKALLIAAAAAFALTACGDNTTKPSSTGASSPSSTGSSTGSSTATPPASPGMKKDATTKK